MKTWVKTISRAKGLNEQLVQEANAKIFTSGSYRLGVGVLKGFLFASLQALSLYNPLIQA